MIFLDNKYTKTYFKIIERAKARPKPDCYTEKHHIIPKCKSFNGPNTKDNLAVLTFKEHWVCHHLLMKMCKTPQQKYSMWFAFDRMGQISKNLGRIKNTKELERIKLANKELCSGQNHPSFGKKGKLHFNYGKKNALGYKHTKEWKKERSKARKGKCFLTIENIQQIKNKLSQQYQIIYPNRSIEVIHNLKEFCRNNKLNSGHMAQVALGKESQHKGFKIHKL